MAIVESFHPMVAVDHPRCPIGVGLQRHRRVAFVLPGGGSLAAPQIGMLRGLTEAQVVPDFRIEALVASAALPGVFPPVRIAGRVFIDGGVSANVPVAQARSLGATRIHVLPAAGPSQAGAGTHRAFGVALRVFKQVLRSIPVSGPFGHEGPNPDLGLELLPTPARTTDNFLDFRASERLIDESCHMTGQWLDHHEPATSAA